MSDQTTSVRVFFQPLPEHDTLNTAYLLWRIAAHVQTAETGCWLWMGALEQREYGIFWVNCKRVSAHRFSYQTSKGPIPEGLELDHLCRVHCCVNPDHLEAVTHQENVRRGTAGEWFGLRQKAKTHCPQGHPYDGHNLVVTIHGERTCRSCHNSRVKEASRRAMRSNCTGGTK